MVVLHSARGVVTRRWAATTFALVALATILLTTTSARADTSFDGHWRQSALREDFTVQQWLASGCGPAPQSSATGGGETVTIRTEGDELAIFGGGRVFRTNQCYDPMPNLSRESHSRDSNGRTWRTRCATQPNDPRKVLLNTLVVATTDTHIDVIETGRYEVVLENGHCTADVKRTRSYDLVQDDAPAATSAPVPPPKPTVGKPEPKPAACNSPGDPSRLEVRPSRKILRTGESFQFRAIVLDDAGCATKTATTWKLASGSETKGVTVDGSGNVTVAKDAPEGSVELLATAAGKDARVTVEVSEPAHYDDLLARSGLNASGENDAASVVSIGTQAVGAGESRVEDRSRTRRMIFVGIVGGALAILLVLALVVLRRSRRAERAARDAEERHDAKVREVLDRRRRRAEEHAAQQRAHEESVASAHSARPAASAPRAGAEKICPICGHEFGGSTAFCPHDGAALVPAAKAAGLDFPVPAAMANAPPPSKRGKICPTCGDRFDGGADYCGKDGTQLVLLN